MYGWAGFAPCKRVIHSPRNIIRKFAAELNYVIVIFKDS